MSALLSRVDGANLDGTVLRCRDLRGELAGGVDRVGLDDEEAAELLLHRGVGAVRHEVLAVADPHRRRRVSRLELGTADDLVALREVDVALVNRLLLLVAQALPVVLAGVVQGQEFHSLSFSQAARSRASMVSCTSRSSGLPNGSWRRSSSVIARRFAVSRSTRFLGWRFTASSFRRLTQERRTRDD